MTGASRKIPADEDASARAQGGSAGKARTGVIAIGLGVVVAIAAGYAVSPRLQTPLTPSFSSTPPPQAPSPESAPPPPPKPEVLLTRASIDLLLADLDHAIKRKDVDGVLRHLAPDAVILIHMKQGSHQQTAMLTREEYRKALTAEFAFPSANDFTRTNTTVSLAPDERSAKISCKTTETLRQADREFTVEGEETLVVRIRGEKPTIVSLEKGVAGDST